MSKNYAGGLITANQNANYSGLFNGSNSYLSVAGAAQYAIATSTTPFTVEAWIRPTVAGGLIFSEEYGAPTIVMSCGLAASNDISIPTGLFPVFGWYNGSAWVNAAASTTAVQLNVWTHVAFVFTGATSKVYINGIDVTKTSAPTPSTTWGITATNGTNWFIGRRWDGSAGGLYFKGNISNFRFVNGTPVYAGNFAPPARLSAITNTVLLTCQSSTFFDASTYNAAITNNAGTVVSQDNPYYNPSNPALGAATPGVWTISEAAAAAGQRSWNMYDPYFNLTTAMIHGNGTNGANNNTFLDSSTNNFTITRNGNTTQGTFTPFSEPAGWWSNFFDGTGDYLSMPSNVALDVTQTDFTIEAWVFRNVAGAIHNIYSNRAAATGNGLEFRINADNTLQVFYTGAGNSITSTVLIAAGVWYHVAAVRSGSTGYLFINGALAGSAAFSNGTVGTGTPKIGADNTNANTFNGYISNFRLIKGTALYTTSFTPSTAPLTAVTNTQLLTCQDNRFVDNSTNNFAITKTGDTRTIGYSPFYSPTAYTPAGKGGAMYFDGTGDSLQLTNSSPLTVPVSTSFTLECWVYLTAAQANYRMIMGDTDSYFAINAAGIEFQFGGNFSATISSCTFTFPVGAWIHIAVVRVTNTVSIYINGVSQTVTNPTQSVKLFGWGSILYIGRWNQATPYNWFGYISNLRLVNGTAVYTSNFTPPTAPLTPITNTQLLLSGTNGAFIDNAANLTIETINATITTSQSKYGVGSMLFNGSTAYASLLTSAGNGASTVPTLGDFTVEGWVYPITANAQKAIFFLNGSSISFGVRIDHNASGAVQLLVSTNNSTHAINITSTSILSTGTWSHIALVRQGPAFIVYHNGIAVITSTAVGVTTAVMAGTLSFLGVLGGLANYFFGAMSDFRITNYARYLGNFVPPTSTLQNQ